MRARAAEAKTMANIDVGPVLEFLNCRTPLTWVRQALADLDTLLLDHAALELKAAQQAQTLIWRYGAAVGAGAGARGALPAAFRSRLVPRMSRLAREELRHFERVVAEIERRGGVFVATAPSRYAAGLHALARRDEPARLVDTLIIGAIIEARSCERFLSLIEPLGAEDAELAQFYATLLRSEARHFRDYLELARMLDHDDFMQRTECLLARDAELVLSPDSELKFHSGPVPRLARSRSRSHAEERAALRHALNRACSGPVR
jgi:tRNA-(ms[2]io[6]A)-hydroxylase